MQNKKARMKEKIEGNYENFERNILAGFLNNMNYTNTIILKILMIKNNHNYNHNNSSNAMQWSGRIEFCITI